MRRQRHRHRHRHRHRLLGAVLAWVTLVLVSGQAAGPAAAFEYPLEFPWELRTRAVVPRLSLQDGVAWLTVRVVVHSDSYTGFEVRIPAGDGEWSADPVVPVFAMGIVCREDPGPDLHIRCGDTQGKSTGLRLPGGSFQVAFRVRHSGHPDGLTGRSFVSAARYVDHLLPASFLGPRHPDVFPVHEQPHPRSTAEIAMASLGPSLIPWHGRATVPVELGVVPGERVTALDVELPRSSWRITGSNAARLLLQCFVRRDGPSLHCRPLPGHGQFIPGRRALTVHLVWGPTPTSSP